MSAFEDFVNTELPKRISTNQNPLTVPSNMVFVTTGVGLQTVLMPYVSGEGGGGVVEISLDSNNALTYGSDGKLYVEKFSWSTTQW